MKIEKQVCDKHSDRETKTTYSVFHERKADGAGSMENWYYYVDLCAECQQGLLSYFVNSYPEEAKQQMDNLGLKGRLG